MATVLTNIRLRPDTLAWVDEIRDGTGLSRARVIELVLLSARDAGWPSGSMLPAAHNSTESGLSAHET